MSCLVEGISLTNLAASPHLETCFSGLSKDTTDVEKNKFSASGCNVFTGQILDAKTWQRGLVDKSNISNLVKKF